MSRDIVGELAEVVDPAEAAMLADDWASTATPTEVAEALAEAIMNRDTGDAGRYLGAALKARHEHEHDDETAEDAPPAP